jgi:hypothetical protein
MRLWGYHKIEHESQTCAREIPHDKHTNKTGAKVNNHSSRRSQVNRESTSSHLESPRVNLSQPQSTSVNLSQPQSTSVHLSQNCKSELSTRPGEPKR